MSLNGPQYIPKGAKSAVVFLHGYGSNGEDLMSLAPVLAEAFPNTAFFAPNGPDQTVYGMGYQWFSDAGGTFDDRTGIGKSQELLASYLADDVWQAHGLKAEKTVLVGFSQGTMTSLFVAPRLADKIAGVAGFSGRLMYEDELNGDIGHRMPIALYHGEDDDVVPAADSRRAQAALAQLGFEVEAHFYPDLPHSIDMRGMNDLKTFLKKVL